MAAFGKYSPIPPRVTQPVKTWVEEEGPRLDPAFATQSRFDYQRAVFSQRQPSRDLSEALYRYEKGAGKEGLIDFSSKSVWTWADVLDEAEQAIEEYEAAGKGARGSVRKLFRRIGDNEPSISPWLDLIPQNSYLSSLNGGLRLLFTVARKVAEKRTLIIESLGDIPQIIEDAYQLRKASGADERLAKAEIDLHYALIDAIDVMISWLLEKPRKKTIKAINPVSQYGEIVDTHLRNVQKRVAAMHHEIEVLNTKKIGMISTGMKRVEREQASVRQTVTITDVRTREIHSSVTNVEKSVSDLSASHAAGVTSQNGLLNLLLDQLEKANWTMARQGAAIESLTQKVAVHELSYRPAKIAYATRPQLLQLLKVDPASMPAETHYVISQEQGADQSSEVRWLFQSSRFQDWLLGSTSDFLFVDDRSELYTLDKVSPFSYLCATLSLSLKEMPEAASIYFYCGLHSGNDDSMSGPEGLVRSLISQLLFNRDFDFHFVSSEQYFAELGQFDLNRLCDTFQHLIQQLPRTTVMFCMIDGLSFYDSLRWREKLYFIVPKLQALVEGVSEGPTLKFLLTTTRSSRQLRGLLPPRFYLEISENQGYCDRGLSGREVSTHIFRSTSAVRGTSTGQSGPRYRGEYGEEYGAEGDLAVKSDDTADYGGDSGIDEDYE